MRKLLYAMAAVAAMGPLAAFGTASAAPAHPAAGAASAVVPDNLPTNKCFKITDANTASGHNYGSLYYNGSKVVTSHTHSTTWCPGPLNNGWQYMEDYNTFMLMAYHASGNYVTEYSGSGGSPTCDLSPNPATANSYCEWAEFLGSNGWGIQSGNNGEWLTAVGSGAAVKLAESGATGDQTWAITCVVDC